MILDECFVNLSLEIRFGQVELLFHLSSFRCKVDLRCFPAVVLIFKWFINWFVEAWLFSCTSVIYCTVYNVHSKWFPQGACMNTSENLQCQPMLWQTTNIWTHVTLSNNNMNWCEVFCHTCHIVLTTCWNTPESLPCQPVFWHKRNNKTIVICFSSICYKVCYGELQ